VTTEALPYLLQQLHLLRRGKGVKLLARSSLKNPASPAIMNQLIHF